MDNNSSKPPSIIFGKVLPSELNSKSNFGQHLGSSQSNIKGAVLSSDKEVAPVMQESRSQNIFYKEEKQTPNIFKQSSENTSTGNPFILNPIEKGEPKLTNYEPSLNKLKKSVNPLSNAGLSSSNVFGGKAKGSGFTKNIFGSQLQSTTSISSASVNTDTLAFRTKAIAPSDLFGSKVAPVFGQIITTTTESMFANNRPLTVSTNIHSSNQMATNLFGGLKKEKNIGIDDPQSTKVSHFSDTIIPSFRSKDPDLIFGSTMKATASRYMHDKEEKDIISSHFGKHINTDKKNLNLNTIDSLSSTSYQSKIASFEMKSRIVDKNENQSELEAILESPIDLRPPTPQTVKSPEKKDQAMSDKDLFGLEPADDQSINQTKKQHASTLIVVGIPDQYLSRRALETHFEKFGVVKKIIVSKKTNQASVYFKNHESAAAAKNDGKILHPKFPEMKLFYSTGTTPSAISRRKSKESFIKVKERPIINYGDIDEFPFSKSKTSYPKHTSSSFSLKSMTRSKVAHASVLLKGKHEDNTSTVNTQSPIPKLFRSSVKNFSKQPKKITKQSSGTKKPEALSSRVKAPSGNLATIKDHSVMMLSQAHNNYDKYLILDARDKNIRSKQEKIVDVTKAHYLLATCPDMCPEKERYSRDIQYDVSAYEMIHGELNNKLSVKKFSRSSADKDEPLPHELRPGSVLKMTMDFLTINIINKEEITAQLDVWYNYLCNRTRALRNDIMTQHLVDENAVYVLEKITRFHIHCSHNLCEEPADLFDSKMNIEHLTKSLQSLKESYYDMAEKGIYFETEAEFRSYEVLLNAYDGNIIFKYLKFRDRVRNSKPVQFAIRVLHAIQSSNYVEFFKVLRQATYLQACIIHRHFLSIRLKALPVIIKAYTLPKEGQVLPISKIMAMLGFGDKEKFKTFIKAFGLQMTENKSNRNLTGDEILEDMIIINPSHFNAKPDSFPSTQKSKEFVESKKTLSAGMEIQGGPLPLNPLPNYVTHNSFNDRGYLKSAAHDASDQQKNGKNLKLNVESPASISDGDESRQQSEEEMLLIKIDEMHRLNVMKKVFRTWITFTENQISQRLNAETDQMNKMKEVIDHWRSFASKSIKLKARADQLLLSKYFARLKKFSYVSKETKLLKSQTKIIFERILARKYLRRWKICTEESKRKIKIEVLRKKIVTRKFLIQWRLKAILSSFEKEVDVFYRIKLLKCIFVKWKNYLNRKKNKRKIDSENFPATYSSLSLTDQNLALGWGYDRDISNDLSADDFYKINSQIYERSKKHQCIESIRGFMAWHPLPFVSKFRDDVRNIDIVDCTSYRIRFKILLLLNYAIDPYLKSWIESKLDCEGSPEITNQFVLSSRAVGTKIHVIFEKKTISSASISDDAAFTIIACDSVQRKQLLSKFAGNRDSLFLSSSLDVSNFEQNSWTLTKTDLDSPEVSKRLFDLVNERWIEYLADGSLDSTPLQNLVQTFISKNVLGPLFHTAAKVLGRNKPFLSPNMFVSFYNDALTYLIQYLKANMRVSDTSTTISLIKQASLPLLNIDNVPSCDEADVLLTDFLRTVADGSDWSGNLYSEVRKITKCSGTVDEDKENTLLIDFDDAVKVPWLDIVTCCIFYKLSYLPLNKIVYDSLSLNEYDNSNWLDVISKSELRNVYEAELKVVLETPKKRKQPCVLHSSEEKRCKKSPTPSKLLLDLAEEKEKFNEFEQKMKNMNDIDEELKYLTRIYNCS